MELTGIHEITTSMRVGVKGFVNSIQCENISCCLVKFLFHMCGGLLYAMSMTIQKILIHIDFYHACLQKKQLDVCSYFLTSTPKNKYNSHHLHLSLFFYFFSYHTSMHLSFLWHTFIMHLILLKAMNIYTFLHTGKSIVRYNLRCFFAKY